MIIWLLVSIRQQITRQRCGVCVVSRNRRATRTGKTSPVTERTVHTPAARAPARCAASFSHTLHYHTPERCEKIPRNMKRNHVTGRLRSTVVLLSSVRSVNKVGCSVAADTAGRYDGCRHLSLQVLSRDGANACRWLGAAEAVRRPRLPNKT